MAAPSIPNLNSLRPRTGLRRGGKARPGPVDPDAPQEDPQDARDKIIRQTDGDASSSRLSAVALGYLNDDFARAFVQGQIPRRYPLINRGTYVRTSAIDRLVQAFLQTAMTEAAAGPVAQIISLGAGSDTRFFRLFPTQRKALVYHELDFVDNVQAKLSAIQSNPALKAKIQESLPADESIHIAPDSTNLYSSIYNLHSIDLRQFATESPPSITNLRTDLPTLLLSECCLCYVPPTTAAQILSYFTNTIPASSLALILYEPIRPYDSFGKTMISNLGSRGIELQTLKRYYSLAAQRERLKKAAFNSGQGARDVEQIYYGDEWVSPAERDRVERLEWLDEVEEWELLARHYCVAWGWRDPPEQPLFGNAWASISGAYTDAENADDDIM